ncbi:MAG: two-component regulator propeller domain-containing protein, partial [Saprospiraceae bacterium]
MFSVTIAAQSSNPFQHISIEKDGIPYTDFTDIIQDTTGYMWLGTKESLLRYDGYEVKLYEENPADSTTLRNGNVQKLFIDTQATLWVGTQAGISRYQPNCDCFINYSLTDNEELTYLDTAFKETDFGFTKESVFAITENQAGQLWVAMYGGGLFQYNRAQDVFTPILNDPQRADFVGNDLISTLLADDQDNLWIGKHTTNSTTTGGLIRYHLPTGSFKRFFHDPQNQHSLIHNHITALTQDEAGRLYIGSNLSGLQEYDYNQQRFIRYDYDIDNPTAFHAPVAKGAVDDERMGVSIIQRDRNGGLWVATYGESLYHFAEDETLTKYNSASNTISPFVNNFFKSFYEDRQGHIWLTTSQSGGLYQLNTHQRKFTRYPQIKGAQRSCESIMEADIVWIGTMGDGLYRLNRKTGDYTQFSPDANDPKSIAHSFVRAVHVTADGTLWLGLGDGGYGGNESGKGGLDHFDPATGVIKHYTFERKDKPEFNWAIYAIHEDSLGRIWFDAGPGGIYRSDRQKQNFKPY